jgi:hypothetical protein
LSRQRRLWTDLCLLIDSSFLRLGLQANLRRHGKELLYTRKEVPRRFAQFIHTPDLARLLAFDETTRVSRASHEPGQLDKDELRSFASTGHRVSVSLSLDRQSASANADRIARDRGRRHRARRTIGDKGNNGSLRAGQTPAEGDKGSARASRCRCLLPFVVCNTDVRVTSQDLTTQMRPQKRLRRGHKFLLLVTTFERNTAYSHALMAGHARKDRLAFEDKRKPHLPPW